MNNKEYWDNTWQYRIRDESHVIMNGEKLDVVCSALVFSGYEKLNKVDIGCGTGIHALRIKHHKPEWVENWTGFDLSESAIEWAKNNGLNAHCVDFTKAQHKNKYDLFLFLDSLEHIEDENSLIETIIKSANDTFIIWGNVPLYKSKHDGGFEREMDIEKICSFLKKCGCDKMKNHIYGIQGYPYMIFEGKGRKKNQ